MSNLLFPFYAFVVFTILLLLFYMLDEGYLATRIRGGLHETFTKNLKTTQIINLSGYLLLFLSGAGLLGLVVGTLEISLSLVFFISTAILVTLSIVYTRMGRKNLNYDLLRTALYSLSSFFFAGFLFAWNYFSGVDGANYPLGITEILGIWLLGNWIFMARTNYMILKIINFGINIVLLIPYFVNQFNIFEFFGIDFKIFRYQTVFFIIPLAIFSINSYLYGKLQMKKTLLPQQKNEYILSGLSAFFSLGAVYVFGYLNYYDLLINSLSETNLEYLFGLTTLWLFGTDYICKKTYKNYNANFLVPILVTISGGFSILLSPNNPFVPMLLTSIGYMIYMMADYLRKNSPITALLFYFSFCLHLVILTFGQDFWSLFLLVIDTLILIYAALVHYKNKFFVYFVTVTVPLCLGFKVFGNSLLTYLFLAGVGSIMLLLNQNFEKEKPQKISKAVNTN
jgi:hypothetical protein